MAHTRMTDLLMEWGLLDVEREAQALVAQRRGAHQNKKIGQVLVDMGFCHRADVVRALAAQAGLRAVDLDKVTPDPRALALLPRDVAMRLKVLPLQLGGPTGRLLGIAIPAPLNQARVDEARRLTGLEVLPYIADDIPLAHALLRAYPEPVEEPPIVAGLEILPETPAVAPVAPVPGPRWTEPPRPRAVQPQESEPPSLEGFFQSHRFDGV